MTSNLDSGIVSSRQLFFPADIQLTCVVPAERTVSTSLLPFLRAYLLEPSHCSLEC